MANGITGWSIEGNDLRTKGYNVHDSSDWDSAGGTRGAGVNVAYQDGAWFSNLGFYDTHIFAVEMLIWGRNPSTGQVTLGSEWEHLKANTDTVKGYFADRGQDLDLRRTMPDNTIRQALGRANLPIRSRVDGAGALRYLTIPFTIREGTWRDITNSVAGETDATNTNLTGSGTFDITTGGNVRTSPIFTVTADSATSIFTLTMPDGAILSYGGSMTGLDVVVIDTAARTVTQNGVNADAGLISTGRRAYWGFLEPSGTNTIGYTIDGQVDVSVQWYNRWR